MIRHPHLLHAAIAAVCPIRGVTGERVISFASGATPEQRAAAAAIAAAWDAEAEDAREDQRIEARAKLDDVDRRTIRALREWVAAQPGAPRAVTDREAEAISEREKLR